LSDAAAAIARYPIWKTWPLADLSVIPLIAFAFVGIALAISSIEGIPFTVPQSGNIPGLNTNYWVPPIAAAVGYLLLQFVVRLFSTNKRTWTEIGRHAVDDYLLLGLFILVIYVHFNIKMWIPVINPRLYDQDYFAIDQAARPLLTLLAFLRGEIARAIPAVDIWYQAAFMAIFVLSFLSHALGKRRWHYHNIVALLLLEMAGPLTYLIMPAVGPFIYERGASALATAAELRMYGVYEQVRAGGAAWIAQHGGQFFAEPLAAMPSLHVGASFVIMYYAIKARSWMAPLCVIVFLWICIESVVTRWHYLIDLPVGLLLAGGAICLANHLCRNAALPETQRTGTQRQNIDAA
ncbi:MAG: phosphatase PAP2 family protein, partial [Dongiaceae bacterium]